MNYFCPLCDRPIETSDCKVHQVAAVASTYFEERPESAESATPGAMFDGRYRLDALLGEGGSGTVYRATQLALSRDVAVKVLRRGRLASKSSLRRFYLEAEALMRLVHPNVVQLFEFGVDRATESPYLVTERVHGVPLTDGAPHAPERATALALQLMTAIAAAHARGIVHRDLKPENVWLATFGVRDERVKVLDFGLAKIVDDPGRAMTAAGVVLGTPIYMSPEQMRGEVAGAAADIYAAGCLIHEMRTGAAPFLGDSFENLLQSKLTGYFEADALLRAMLDPEAARRPSAEEVIAALERGGSLPSIPARATSPGRDPRFLEMQTLQGELAPAGKKVRRIHLPIGVIAGAAVGIAAWVASNEDERAPPIAPAPVLQPSVAPRFRKIQLRTEPPGAEVFVDGLSQGRSPLEVELSGSGSMRVELEGHRPEELLFGSEVPDALMLRLEKVAPAPVLRSKTPR